MEKSPGKRREDISLAPVQQIQSQKFHLIPPPFWSSVVSNDINMCCMVITFQSVQACLQEPSKEQISAQRIRSSSCSYSLMKASGVTEWKGKTEKVAPNLCVGGQGRELLQELSPAHLKNSY